MSTKVCRGANGAAWLVAAAALAGVAGMAHGQSWIAAGGNLYTTASKTGIGTTNPQLGKLEVQSAGDAIISIYGLNYATTGDTRGLYGSVLSPSGYGGVGYAQSLTGLATGLWGGTQADNGIGVQGISYTNASTGTPRGVYGEAINALNGTGVFGVGVYAGVQGQSYYPNFGWAGVFFGNTYHSGKAVFTNGAIEPSLGNVNTGGIQFPLNPAGGGGDEAFIRYHAVSGEDTRFVIGTENDANDALVLHQFGQDVLNIRNASVGIGTGTSTPGAKLQVNGNALVNSTLVVGQASGSSAYPLLVNGGTFGLVHTNGTVQVGTYVGGSAGGWFGTITNHPLYFYTNNGNGAVTLNTNGTFYVASTLIGPGKQFLIDHPSDPENKTLRHGCIESDEWTNMYRGNARLDSSGSATVTLPSWMEDLNENFSYQLTCVGGFAPVYVAEEMTHGRFVIAGGTPDLKVSWVVSGTRKDPWARANPIAVEEDKAPADRGRFLQPAAYGVGPERAIGPRKLPEAAAADGSVHAE